MVETRGLLDRIEAAVAAARASALDEFRHRALSHGTSYGSLADCIQYVHYAGAYGQAAQAMLESGNLEAAEHLLSVAQAYAGSAGDCLDEIPEA